MKELPMADLSDLSRALVYGESELGEVAVHRPSDNTYTVRRAKDNATVLAAGTAATTIKTRVAAIHPSVLKITS
jgi:hypothetical protein